MNSRPAVPSAVTPCLSPVALVQDRFTTGTLIPCTDPPYGHATMPAMPSVQSHIPYSTTSRRIHDKT